MKKISILALSVLTLSLSASAAEVCKIRSVGGSNLGLAIGFPERVSARTLEDCQSAAKALLGKTEIDPQLGSQTPNFYRPWKVWYKWEDDQGVSKGSYTAKNLAGPTQSEEDDE